MNSSKALARLGRENHLKMLLGRLPLITIIYGIQCYALLNWQELPQAKDLCTFLGLFLVSLVSLLYVHDKYHHVLLYDDHMLLLFEPFNTMKKITYNDIKEIHIPRNECDFSSILLELKDKSKQTIHFVDNPLQVKKFINQLQNRHESNKNAA